MTERIKIIRATFVGAELEEELTAHRFLATQCGSTVWVRHYDEFNRLAQVSTYTRVERFQWFPDVSPA